MSDPTAESNPSVPSNPWTPAQPMTPPEPMVAPQPAVISPTPSTPVFAPPGMTVDQPATPGVSGVPAGWPAGYSAPGYYGPYQAPRPTNGLAIAAMILGIVAVAVLPCYGAGGALFGPVGAILGHVARRKVKASGEEGGGMALAGIIMGWIATAIGVVAIGLIIWFVVWVANQPYDGNYDSYNDLFAALAGML